MPDPAASRIVQNCYVVRDLERACAEMHALMGIGPFVGGVEVELGNHVYHCKPTTPIRLRGVFVQSGDLNIELVQLLSSEPSAFRDMYPGDGEGMHHIAMFSDDYEGDKRRWLAAGHPVTSEFTTPFGAKICYVDTRSRFGHFLELYPEHPVIRAMYAQTVDEARSWDRRQLIVPWR